ncbi:MAG: thymidine phosphorylase [Verrucomicrobiota bacterium]
MKQTASFLQLLEAKRDGQVLEDQQIACLVQDFTAGRIPDYQMATFLMAVFFRGLIPAETRALTLAMRDSGDVLRFPADARPLVDKHSTGGIGDKVSLPLAPLLAAMQLRVPMISGRGLGITGGTLDKLESIPGLSTQLPPERIVAQVQTLGVAMAGQTDTMVPADKRIYALRDVTGTVPSIPLITASILSKKLAENLQALVMDIKFGCAAFMSSLDQARTLATGMSQLAKECGLPMRALLTRMDTPLGCAAGNWLEIKETMDCLNGQGPADLRALVLECAAHLLVLTKRFPTLVEARRQAGECLDSHLPREKWLAMIAAQGANLDTFQRKLSQDHTAPVVRELPAPHAGYVQAVDARIVGEVVRDLGGGRLAKDSIINPDVGVDRLAKPGQKVAAREVLVRVHAAQTSEAEIALHRLATAFRIAEEPPSLPPLIQEVV